MSKTRAIHSDFLNHLNHYDQALIDLYMDVRAFILALHPRANELLYHTHALTSVYSHSEKLGDAYCHIPIYSAHLNIGLNKGALLDDPHAKLAGTGKLIRHIKVTQQADYRNPEVEQLILSAMAFAADDMDQPASAERLTISKIKK